MKDERCKMPILQCENNRKTSKTRIVTCKTAKKMYDTLKQIYQRDTSQQKYLLLQDFYNIKYDKTKDMMTNLSCVQNIVFKLNQLN
jgi:hypothetical protein